ncbi:hypothetical protein ACHWQZ_G002522 [Mnemiopsis leidyi]
MAVQYRAKRYLEELGETSIGTDNHFCEDNVKEVRSATNMLLNDICRVYGINGPDNFTAKTLDKPSVVKAQMAEWLYSALQLLDYAALPLMSNASSQLERLRSDKISDQEEIIQLQRDLVHKKNEEIGLVSKTVEAELKTYSSVLQQSCSSALSPRKIAAAVKTVSKEEDRSKEIVVFGVEEKQGESVNFVVNQILEHLEEKQQIKQCRRIGLKHRTVDLPDVATIVGGSNVVTDYAPASAVSSDEVTDPDSTVVVQMV